MYAVFATGGKQYRAAPGDVLRVEKLDVEAGATVELDQVLMVSNEGQINVGAPTISGASVSATVRGHGRGDKILVVKFRRRKHHRKQM
ncbi:MAG: 50S ribosomal protein L21, partial [Xanthomonadales bacterium]|nr:50S ribosomal protein L21 [Xanthomonadales bacterium]